MALKKVQFVEQFNAPITAVFEFFGTHENLSIVFGGDIRRIAAAPTGEDPNGLGSVRSIKAAPAPVFEETVTRHEPPSLIEYKITKGSPIKNHIGLMRFSESGGVTTLDYTIQFEGKLPGTTGLLIAVLKKTINAGMPKARRIIEG